MKNKKNNICKNVIFSFDDGRKDTYEVAYKIMKENDIVGTIHVITGTFDGSFTPTEGFSSGNRKFVSLNDLYDMKENGFEISSHSDNHTNEQNRIKKSLNKLVDYKLMDKDFLTFSSPNSEINEKNYKQYKIEDLKLKYLRTGVQMRNEKLLKKIAYIFSKIFKSKLAFYYLNKDNILSKNEKLFFIKTVTIKKDNTFEQIKYLIKRLKNEEAIVLLFHSINLEKEISDDWGYYVEDFKKLCEFVTNDPEIKNDTIRNLVIKYS